ncbi:ANTAR domain-containing protein [Streptomyces massasporeus]|uniref:ANTAR domain-containing protein n=1 Tax=Streptomyces massasporeus TaxID=67324 RepID=UPI0036F006EC
MRPSRGPGPRRGEIPGDAQREGREQVEFPAEPLSVDTTDQLHEEAEQLKAAMERRPVIDMAKGVLMATWSCTEDEAWQMLVWVSQHSNIKLHDVAEAVVAATQQEPMPARLQERLAEAVRQWHARRDPSG